MIHSYSFSTVPTTTTSTSNKTKTNPHQFIKTNLKQSTHRLKTSCNATDEDHKATQKLTDTHNLDRRNLILGFFGSLFGAASLTSSLSSALAVPTADPPKDRPLDRAQPAEERASSLYTKKYESAAIDQDMMKSGEDKSVGSVKKVEDIEFPVKLDKTVKVLVKRPAVNRTKEDKKKASETLVVNGINFDGEKYVKFDVLVNDKDDEDKITASDSEFAGSFAQMPHGKTNDKMMMNSGARFGLTELLEDIKAEDDEYIVVTLLPKTGSEDVTVSEIKIELVPIG